MKFKIRNIKHKVTGELCFKEKELKISKVPICFFTPLRKIHRRYITLFYQTHKDSFSN